MDNGQKHIQKQVVKWLRELAEKIESGECEVEELERAADTWDQDDYSTQMRRMLYTGKETVTIQLIWPEKVKEFNRARMSLRDPDIPAHLYDRIDRHEVEKKSRNGRMR